MSLSASDLAQLLCDLGSGQNKHDLWFGLSAFTTTGTTKDVTVPLKNIKAAFAIPYGTAAAANGQLTVDETFPLRSTVGAQDVTVTRAAGTDSGLKFIVVAIGEK